MSEGVSGGVEWREQTWGFLIDEMCRVVMVVVEVCGLSPDGFGSGKEEGEVGEAGRYQTGEGKN